MRFRDRIREFLGLDVINDEIGALHGRLSALDSTLKRMKNVATANSVALGRVLARDPANTVDELDPMRKAESDRLGREAIARLQAEDAARRHTLGEP